MGGIHDHSHDYDHDHDHADHHGHAHDDHDHGHSHGHHDHARGASEVALLAALWITAGFMVAEAIGGWLAGSLALLADAAHMLADAGALAMGYAAARAARRPVTEIMSYGHHRWQVLAAFVNGLLLLLLSFWIVFEAVARLSTPSSVDARTMLVIGALGVIANLASYGVLSRGTHSLNVRSALLHVFSDILGNIGAVLAAVVILLTHWTPIDPILSIVMALLVVRSGIRITRESAHILLEGTPQTLNVDAVAQVIRTAVPSVSAVHHVHAWSLTDEKPMLTLHVVMSDGGNHTECLEGIHRALRERLNIGHATVQIETVDCGDGADCAHVQQLRTG